MTMPSKIWAGQYPNNPSAGDWDVVQEFTSDTPYIRADIAEELARALEMAQVWLCYDGRFDMQGINAALARYHSATNS